VSDTVQQFCGTKPGLKWPNDVLLVGKKVAGILVETERDEAGNWWALAGIGLNVNVDTFPEELASHATSLFMQTGTGFDLDIVEEELRARVFSAAELVGTSGSEPILEAWRERDHTRGMRFSFGPEGNRQSGIAMGISDSGALILQLEDGSLI